MLACMAVFLLQDTVQTVQALKGASSQMRGAMKHNKELDLNFIDNLQVCAWSRIQQQSAATDMQACGSNSNRRANGLMQQD
jgi:hypothetical protein